jgi:hypothetical protein
MRPPRVELSSGEVHVDRHGSETYFVIGEGLLGESGNGRDQAAVAIEIETAEAAAPFRFSRMGPKGSGVQIGKPARLKVAQAMTADNLAQGGIPAGFTYLGQFIDHDLTFDKSSLMEGVDISPATLLQARSPSLDLDSLYGNGPGDPGSVQFYAADGVHLKMGAAAGGPPGSDLPRDPTGLAIIADERNDENLAVAQTHSAFIRFHNRVVDSLPPSPDRFKKARRIVTKHYQWMIRSDYLTRICAPAVVTDVFKNGRKAFEVNAAPTSMPTMPIEFSVAAFRLGHSMIRATYSWNQVFPGATLKQLFDFSHKSGGLPGPIPDIWIADFRRLFNFGQLTPPKPALVVPPALFNRAMRIDTKLVVPLATLPVSDPAPENNLAFRNLLRANMVKLATGQQMVKFMQNKGVAITKLTKAQVRDGNGGASLGALSAAQRDAVLANTPLWFYLLREAELNGGVLKGVGARIVAETFHRAIEGSTFSIVRDKAFRPSLGPNNTTFRMVDLLNVAFNGDAALLNPNG